VTLGRNRSDILRYISSQVLPRLHSRVSAVKRILIHQCANLGVSLVSLKGSVSRDF
jgi:hypothetical protein